MGARLEENPATGRGECESSSVADAPLPWPWMYKKTTYLCTREERSIIVDRNVCIARNRARLFGKEACRDLDVDYGVSK